VEKVHKLLRDAGVEGDLEDVSNCLKRAILEGHIKIDGPDSLDQIVIEDKCFCCSDNGDKSPIIKVTVRDLLHQEDYAGTDYEDGGLEAEVFCPKCEVGIYVTHLCEGEPEFDSGKFHNHCDSCPDFGICIGDYREAHCDTCGQHYFSGLSGFPCYYCHPDAEIHECGSSLGDYSDDSDDSGFDSDDDDDLHSDDPQRKIEAMQRLMGMSSKSRSIIQNFVAQGLIPSSYFPPSSDNSKSKRRGKQ